MRSYADPGSHSLVRCVISICLDPCCYALQQSPLRCYRLRIEHPEQEALEENTVGSSENFWKGGSILSEPFECCTNLVEKFSTEVLPLSLVPAGRVLDICACSRTNTNLVTHKDWRIRGSTWSAGRPKSPPISNSSRRVLNSAFWALVSGNLF